MMKVLDTKILNGEKLFLIEDTPIKAEAGVNANSYYVPIQGINYSDNTRTKLTPKVELTVQEKNQLKQSPTALANIKVKSEKEKKERLAKSESAYQKRIETGIQSSQDLADETGAIGDKISLQNLPYIGKYIPDILDVTGMIGNMASGLGRVPLNLEQRNYGQAALSVATPLTVGALAGLGTQNTSQFVNNVINPLAGIKLKANLPEGTVQNGFSLSKLNERINLEPNELMGTNAYKIKLKDKWIGDFQLEKSLKDEGKIAIGNVYIKEPYRGKGFGKQVFTEGNKLLNDTEQGVLHSSGFFEGNDAKHVWNSLVKEGKAEQIGKDAWRFIEKSPSSKNFKSEINWRQWNKEIPDNPQLIKEYNTIEQTSKANNTWMKNPDGSAFQGSPEQFIQQNSENFKKAFPEGFNTTYRGTMNHFVENFNPNRSMATFTGSKDLASSYSGKGWSTDVNYLTADSPEFSNGMYELAHPKSTNSLTFNGMNGDWTSISLLPPEVKKKTILDNISRMSSSIEKQKSFLNSGIQDPVNKSWKFPDNDVIYSDELYKQGTTNMENILKGHKESLKYADQPLDNPTLLENMRKKLGDRTITDDIAKYIKDNNVDYVKINNINDGGFGDVSMVNHKEGNFLKSLRGNNGMFDMKNPNIYKTIVGGLATGTLGKQAMEKKEFGGKIKILKTKISNGKTLHLIED